MTRQTSIALALLASSLIAGSAAAQSAFNWNSLKLEGEANPRPWCGQWWGHRCNGTALNSQNNKTSTYSCGYGDAKSPVEKLDAMMGRANRIEHQKLDKWLSCSLAAWSDCQSMSGQARSKCIQNSTKQRKYGACQKGFTVDTAYEYEIVNHGQGAYGWDSWWGHCNAWAAAAVLYPEPIKPATVGGHSFTVADVKGLLTEVLMDVDLAADGWFGCRYDGPGTARAGRPSCSNDSENYYDVTPRQMISALSKHIGSDRHGVVIDRHTDWEVWNQPLWKYSIRGCRDSQDAALCGAGVTKKTCNLSFTWAEDGVGHGEVCTPPEGYTERTLAFSICVKDGNILGDRRNQRWEVSRSVPAADRWPDFIWVPGNLSAQPDNGNPFVHSAFDKIKAIAQQAAVVAAPNASGAAKDFKVDVNKPIPELGDGLTQTINVTSDAVPKGLALCMNIDHKYRGDLVVTLISPTGARERIWDRSGGSEDHIHDCHDASSARFSGRSAKGTWKVQVQDFEKGNKGTWKSATLKLLQ